MPVALRVKSRTHPRPRASLRHLDDDIAAKGVAMMLKSVTSYPTWHKPLWWLRDLDEMLLLPCLAVATNLSPPSTSPDKMICEVVIYLRGTAGLNQSNQCGAP